MHGCPFRALRKATMTHSHCQRKMVWRTCDAGHVYTYIKYKDSMEYTYDLHTFKVLCNIHGFA